MWAVAPKEKKNVWEIILKRIDRLWDSTQIFVVTDK
jgi:hypothetical protein